MEVMYMKNMRKISLALLMILCISGQLTAADGETTSFSFSDFMQGPEMYMFLQDTHKILGYTSAALGIAACIFNPALVDDDLHGTLGQAAAITSGLNIGVGLINYSDRIFSSSDEKADTSDVFHAAMSVAGSILMVAAAGLEPEDDEGSGGAFTHAALGIAGAGLMASAILFEW